MSPQQPVPHSQYYAGAATMISDPGDDFPRAPSSKQMVRPARGHGRTADAR